MVLPGCGTAWHKLGHPGKSGMDGNPNCICDCCYQCYCWLNVSIRWSRQVMTQQYVCGIWRPAGHSSHWPITRRVFDLWSFIRPCMLSHLALSLTHICLLCYEILWVQNGLNLSFLKIVVTDDIISHHRSFDTDSRVQKVCFRGFQRFSVCWHYVHLTNLRIIIIIIIRDAPIIGQ